jgi:hypothetical protein
MDPINHQSKRRASSMVAVDVRFEKLERRMQEQGEGLLRTSGMGRIERRQRASHITDSS